MKFLITIIILTMLFVTTSCSKNGIDLPPSTLTKIHHIQLSSQQSTILKNTFFSINNFNNQIWNEEFLPRRTKLKRIKLKISTHFASQILINHYQWNGLDSIEYTNQPIIITVIAQNQIATQDYTLKVNIK